MPDILQLVTDSFDPTVVAAEEAVRRQMSDAEVAALTMEIDGPDADADGDYDDDDGWGAAVEDYGDDAFIEEGALEGDLDVEED